MKFALLLTPDASAPVCTFTAYTPQQLRAELLARMPGRNVLFPAVYCDAMTPYNAGWCLLSDLPRDLPLPHGSLKPGLRGSLYLREDRLDLCDETACAYLIRVARDTVARGEEVAAALASARDLVEDAIVSATHETTAPLMSRAEPISPAGAGD